MKESHLILIAVLLTALPLGAARNFVAASSQYGNSASFTGATDYPMTLAVWANPTVTNVAAGIIAVNSPTTSRAGISCGAGGSLAAFCSDSSGVTASSSFTNASAWTPGVWAHACAVFAATNSRSIYINGTLSASDTATNLLAGADRVVIGMRIASGSPGAYFSGVLAEAAVWNVALSAPEIASLAAGFKPNRVRPQNLVFYAPLWGDASPEPNVGGTSVTLTNAPAKSDHPRIY